MSDQQSGHDHHRTDGGPEPTGANHDRLYPDCSMAEEHFYEVDTRGVGFDAAGAIGIQVQRDPLTAWMTFEDGSRIEVPVRQVAGG